MFCSAAVSCLTPWRSSMVHRLCMNVRFSPCDDRPVPLIDPSSSCRYAMPAQSVLAPQRAWLPTRCKTRHLRAAKTFAVVPHAFMVKHDAAQLTSAVERYVAAVNAHDVEGLCSQVSKNVVSARSQGDRGRAIIPAVAPPLLLARSVPPETSEMPPHAQITKPSRLPHPQVWSDRVWCSCDLVGPNKVGKGRAAGWQRMYVPTLAHRASPLGPTGPSHSHHHRHTSARKKLTKTNQKTAGRRGACESGRQRCGPAVERHTRVPAPDQGSPAGGSAPADAPRAPGAVCRLP